MIAILRPFCRHRRTERVEGPGGGELQCLDCRKVQVPMVTQSGFIYVAWIALPCEGVVWLEGKPETALTFKGWWQRLWRLYRLSAGSSWPKPWQARRTCSSQPWTALEIEEAGGPSAIARMIESHLSALRFKGDQHARP